LTPDFARILLTSVIIVEVFLAMLLWISAFNWLGISKKGASDQKVEKVLVQTNLVLIVFMGLWFFFWVGGLWFGYWLKMPQVQQVHMSLIALSIIVLIFINLPQRSHYVI
jgi:predicted small integral membrane protein